jgi:hypothetical protein
VTVATVEVLLLRLALYALGSIAFFAAVVVLGILVYAWGESQKP